MERPLVVLTNLLHAQETLTGTGYYAQHLVNAMLALPEAPRIIALVAPINKRAWHFHDAPNLRVVTWGSNSPSVTRRRLHEWLRLPGAARGFQPDLFWCPSNFLPWWRLGFPMAVTVHDMTFFAHPETLPRARRIYWHAWTRNTLRVANAILTVSEAARTDIATLGRIPAERVTVVPNGTGPAFFIGEDVDGRLARRKELLAKYPNLPDRYVLFLGTLTPHKNVPRLVEAAARARANGCEDLKLVLAGKRGTDYPAIAAAIDYHRMADHTMELGYVPDEFMPALYENARAHVLPSFTEGFGLPIVEAMACGTPIITGNTGAMAEVAGEAGVLVDPRSTESMASAIAQLWRDDAFHAERRALGLERSRQFTWENSARRTFDVFHQLVRRRQPPSSSSATVARIR